MFLTLPPSALFLMTFLLPPSALLLPLSYPLFPLTFLSVPQLLHRG